MNLDELSPELRAKVVACDTPEELHALAKSIGYELSDEELTSISGGSHWYECPCNSKMDDCLHCYTRDD